MGNISSRGAMAHILESLEYEWADPNSYSDADSMIDSARESLEAYIDNGLIYTADVLELWDGSTNENVYVESGANVELSDLVAQSVYFQLSEEWDWVIYDAVDDFLAQKYAMSGLGSLEGLDRDDLFEALT